MKIYAKRNGAMVEAEVEDRAVYLEIGSTDAGTGDGFWRQSPITAIDWEARTIQRHQLGPMLPFPEKFYRESDIEWKPSKIGAGAALTLQEIQ